MFKFSDFTTYGLLLTVVVAFSFPLQAEDSNKQKTNLSE